MSSNRLLQLICLLSLLGLIGSIYVSRFGDPRANIVANDLRNSFLGAPACTVCRYTRICLFPIFVISAIALWSRDEHARKMLLPFGILGMIFTTYNYGLEMDRWTGSAEFCGINSTVQCGNPPIQYRGWFTLSLAGFAIFFITTLSCLRIWRSQKVISTPMS